MQLEDLIGLHHLSGVDFSSETAYDGVANVINFVLDGVTYSAIEDPNDGYRSAMQELKVSDFVVTNVFTPVQVMCVKRIGRYRDDYDILDCYDTKNGKLILSVGTDHSDSYYPSFISDFSPENMSINEQ